MTVKLPPPLRAELDEIKAEQTRLAARIEQLEPCSAGEHLVHVKVPDGVHLCHRCIRAAEVKS